MEYRPKKEKHLWSTDIIENYIYFTGTCPVCFHETFKIYEKKNEDIINPYYARCSSFLIFF